MNGLLITAGIIGVIAAIAIKFRNNKANIPYPKGYITPVAVMTNSLVREEYKQCTIIPGESLDVKNSTMDTSIVDGNTTDTIVDGGYLRIPCAGTYNLNFTPPTEAFPQDITIGDTLVNKQITLSKRDVFNKFDLNGIMYIVTKFGNIALWCNYTSIYSGLIWDVDGLSYILRLCDASLIHTDISYTELFTENCLPGKHTFPKLTYNSGNNVYLDDNTINWFHGFGIVITLGKKSTYTIRHIVSDDAKRYTTSGTIDFLNDIFKRLDLDTRVVSKRIKL